MPSLFMRTYGVTAKQVGVIYGPLQIFSGCVGVLAGPTVNRILARRWPKTSVLMCVVFVALAMIAVMIALPFAPTFPAALGLAAASTFCYSFPQAIATSALIFATPNRMRGIVGSLYTFCLSGFGLGFGPTIVALVTDYGFKDPALVNFSLPLVCACAGLLGAIFALCALPAFRAIVADDAQPAAAPSGAPATAS